MTRIEFVTYCRKNFPMMSKRQILDEFYNLAKEEGKLHCSPVHLALLPGFATADVKVTRVTCGPQGEVCKKSVTQEGEKEMYASAHISDVATQEQAARLRLEGRLASIYAKADQKLMEKHGLVDLPRPTSFKELKELMDKGFYVVHEDDGKSKYQHPLDYVSFRDPSVKKDQEGYNKARDELKAAKDATLDEIYVFSAEKGLESLRAFEKAYLN